MTDLVGHFLIFAIVGIGFVLAPLLLGKLVRPRMPNLEKDAAYECGEPTIGSSYIQFDLRFYVVALLFIIFDVEVVFFFPWAAVYGNAVQLADTGLPPADRVRLSEQLMSLPSGTLADAGSAGIPDDIALKLSWIGVVDVLIFFAVLLVGFAYVWKRGDLDWVHAVSEEAKKSAAPSVVGTRGSQRPAPQTVG